MLLIALALANRSSHWIRSFAYTRRLDKSMYPDIFYELKAKFELGIERGKEEQAVYKHNFLCNICSALSEHHEIQYFFHLLV